MLFTLIATGSATLGSSYGTTHRSLLSSEFHCSGPRIPMSEVKQVRSRWSRLNPLMSPLSSMGIVTNVLLSQDTLSGCSLLTALVILLIECSSQTVYRISNLYFSYHSGIPPPDPWTDIIG